MSYQSALNTLQWSTHIEVDEPDGSTYFDGTNFEPSKELEQRILTDWENFQAQAIELGFDPEKHRITYINLSEGDYWDYAAHDFILTRNGHGAGFWDGDWHEPMATKLTELCKKFGEINIYLSDENLLEVY